MTASLSKPEKVKTSRFFVALLPPKDVQAEATAVKTYFRDHYQSQAALRSPPHVTLQPPFEWAREDCDRLWQTLAAFAQQQPPVPMTLSGFSAFAPRVIFINVVKTPELMALQPALMNYLADTLSIVDARSRNRPFAPHLTVAFRDLKPGAFRRAWPEFEQRSFQAKFTVPELTLLIHDGQRWQIAQNFPFQQI
ncbi:MAG: 2'-5' RNA ligase family protein [Cyanobacteria bacterium Co-bin13]|nr:2'-5' RNA ligase family protein [Cyanobacteria bacterium Co-bin13]